MSNQEIIGEAQAEVSQQVTVGDKTDEVDGKVARNKKDTTQTATTGQDAKAAKTKDDKPKNQFQTVVAGVCPHCGAKLNEAIAGKGIGKARTCKAKECGHRWYFNEKIKTSKCLTCAANKRKKS